MPWHQQNCDLSLSVLTGEPVRKEDFFKITQVLYCIYFPSGLCRAKILLLLNLLLFYSKTCWEVKAQGGLIWQRMSRCLAQSEVAWVPALPEQRNWAVCVHLTNEGKQNIICSRMLNRLGGIKIWVSLNIPVLPKVKLHQYFDRDLSKVYLTHCLLNSCILATIFLLLHISHWVSLVCWRVQHISRNSDVLYGSETQKKGWCIAVTDTSCFASQELNIL